MIIIITEILFALLTAVMVAYLARHYIFTISVLRSAKKPKAPPKPASSFEPSVSILIPAFNEEKVIGRLLQRITELSYPKNKLQTVVIDDSSTDKTGQIADNFQKRYPYIEVLHRDRATGGKGKSSAMNNGFAKATGEIVLCFDADYYPQRDIVEKLTRWFIDPKVGAVQGRVVVLNEPQNIVTRIVTLERIGGYRVDQEARDTLGLITQFGGTVGGFRKDILERLNGWDESILAEDTDLTLRIYLSGYKVSYDVDAECYEEAVDNWRAYRRQRYRWSKGHMQCFFKHAWSVLKSKNLSVKQKLDGLLLLNVYFMPIIAFASLLIGLALMFSGLSLFSLPAMWFWIPISLYSFVGNFAPFFEVGVGLYLDGRTRSQWLIPLLLFIFFYNIPICFRAFFSVLFQKITRGGRNVWVKTHHYGNGGHYIEASEE